MTTKQIATFALVATMGVVVVGAAIATPGTGILAAPTLSRAALGGDVLVQLHPGTADGLRWKGRDWTASDAPEFLAMLRDRGKVSDLGGWLIAHPTAAGKLGLPAVRRITSAEFAVQQVTIAPGGATGWHTHPGPAIVLVKSGEFTLYNKSDAACRGTMYKAGQSFIDAGFGNVHIGRNEGAANVELYVVYLIPLPSGQSPRIDAPAPGNCSF